MGSSRPASWASWLEHPRGCVDWDFVIIVSMLLIVCQLLVSVFDLKVFFFFRRLPEVSHSLCESEKLVLVVCSYFYLLHQYRNLLRFLLEEN